MRPSVTGVERLETEEGQALAGLRQTSFTGNTLRGLLLYGYAFATMGTIAGIAALCAFAGAIVLVLGLLGLRHAGRAAALETRPTATPADRRDPAAGPGSRHSRPWPASWLDQREPSVVEPGERQRARVETR